MIPQPTLEKKKLKPSKLNHCRNYISVQIKMLTVPKKILTAQKSKKSKKYTYVYTPC
jgi:hypothetical protein